MNHQNFLQINFKIKVKASFQQKLNDIKQKCLQINTNNTRNSLQNNMQNVTHKISFILKKSIHNTRKNAKKTKEITIKLNGEQTLPFQNNTSIKKYSFQLQGNLLPLQENTSQSIQM